MLNPKQLEAVQTTKGRLLVLAGAGSGKTRVIVHRIAYLIEEKGIAPKSILGLTFTNKAAAEMRERVSALIGPASKEVTLATFHSFCMQLLRKEIHRLGYTQNFSLYDERDLDRVIKQLVKEMLGHEGELPSLALTKAAMAQAANSGHKTLSFETDSTEHTTKPQKSNQESQIWHDAFSKKLYERLQSTLCAYNALSFDHLIHLTIRLFEEHPEVLAKYQDRYQYLMIDEYQDTNPSQFRLAELLSSRDGNLCVVGDDDQSIYGWRGAEVNHILEFKADKTIKLEQNYRSTTTILDAANAVIAHNQTRLGKNLWSTETNGSLIEVFNAPTDAEEAAAVVQRLLRLKETLALKWREMAILYRSNALSRQFEMALMQASWQKGGHWVRGIPYEIFGGLEFSERSEIKDLLAYLRVIDNEKDEEALLRIINVPRRGISDLFLSELTERNRAEKIPLWHLLKKIANGEIEYPSHPKGAAGIRSFISLIEKAAMRFKRSSLDRIDSSSSLKTQEQDCAKTLVQQSSLADALSWLLEEIQYKKAIEDEVKSDKMRLFKWENVQECVSAIAQYEEEAGDEASLSNFLANTALARPTFTAEMKRLNEDKVQLMTLHSAKGLEFPACFIVGLEDHILPHEKSAAETGLEEERRLFYVGLTRARKYLTLSMARSRMRMGKINATNPSRFLFEIPKHLLKATSFK